MKVFIITQSVRHGDGEFTKHVDTVYATKEQARARFAHIKKGCGEGMFARSPISQPDDLSVRDEAGNCVIFYSIVERAVVE